MENFNRQEQQLPFWRASERFLMSREPAMAEVGTIERAYADGYAAARDEIDRLRTALQNCRMFFDANNRPNYVAMIDVAMGNEQIGGKDGR
jgi:hypothetical protein